MSFNFSPIFFDALTELRQKPHKIEELCLSFPSMSSDEIEYLRMENCVRCDQYSLWDSENTRFESCIMLDLANCYFYLYTNPRKATFLSLKILENYDLVPELNNRVQFWLMDSYFLTGHKREGTKLLEILDPEMSGPAWLAESQTIKALCLYFINDLDSAMKMHLECQKTLDRNKDNFLSIFNSSMALRIALKLCEPIYFDYFSGIISINAIHTSEKRYTARIHTYKALLLVQMHRPQEAAEEWQLADELIPFVEMKWEKGQYYLLRGFSSILCGMKEEGERFLKASEEYLLNAGSPPPYIADLEIAKLFNDWRSPTFLSKGLLNIQLEISRAITVLEGLRRDERFFNVKDMFEDAIDYCHMIISGTPFPKKYSSSLIVSILLNSSRADVFGSSLSDFKTYSSFVNSILSSESYALENLQPRLEQVVGFSLLTDSGKFLLNQSSSKVGGLNKLLSFANHLISLNSNLLKTNELKAKADLSKRLSHDLRSPLNQLRNISEFELNEKTRGAFLVTLNSIEDMCNEVLYGSDHNFEKRAFDFRELISKIVKNKILELPSLEIELITLDPIFIFGISPVKFERIISNLINNSFEANATRVEITSELIGEELILKIRDDGNGLDESRIETFNSGNDIETDKTFGSGIGLSSSATYIREANGSITLRNDNGLCVIINWPHVLATPKELFHFEDDKYIRRDWINRSIKKEIKFYSYDHFKDLEIEKFPLDSSYFIDANLSDPLDGLFFAKKLYDRGIRKIFLSSGIDLNEIQDHSYIKAVVDKRFPF